MRRSAFYFACTIDSIKTLVYNNGGFMVSLTGRGAQ